MSESELVLVLLVIGGRSGANIFRQSCSVVDTINKLKSVFYASVQLLIMNFVITLSK